MADKNGAEQPIPDTHKDTILDGVLESFEEDPQKYSLELVRLYSDSNTQALFKGREREVLDKLEKGAKPSDSGQVENLAFLMSELQKQVNGRQIVVGDKKRIRSTGTAVHGILEDFDEDPDIHVKYFHEYFQEHPELFKDEGIRAQVVSKLKAFLASDSEDYEARAKAAFLIKDFTGEEVPMDKKALDASLHRQNDKIADTQDRIRVLKDKMNGKGKKFADEEPEAKPAAAIGVRPPVSVEIPPRQIIAGGISDSTSDGPVAAFGNGNEKETRAEMPAIGAEDDQARQMPAVTKDDMMDDQGPEPQSEDSATVSEKFEQWKAVIQTVCFNQAFAPIFEDTLMLLFNTLALPDLQERFELCDYLYNALDPSSWNGFLVIECKGLSVKVKKECVIVDSELGTEVFDIKFFDAVKSGRKFSAEEYKVLNALYTALYKAVLADYERVNGFFREFEQVKEFVLSNIPDKESLISGFWPTVFGKLIQASVRLSDEQRESKDGKEYWERFTYMMEAVYGEGNWLGFQILERDNRSVYFQPGIVNVVDKSGKKERVYRIDLDENEGTEAAEKVLAEVSSEIIMKVPITSDDLMNILVKANDQDTVRNALIKKLKDTRTPKNDK